MNLIDNQILKRYLKMVLDSYFPNANTSNEDDLHFRCNICGDSKKSTIKKRAHFKLWNDRIIFKCFNCGFSITPAKWLKKYFPSFHTLYVKDLMQLKGIDTFNVSIPVQKLKITPKRKITGEVESILKNELAIEIVKNRKIPYDIYKKWKVGITGTYRNRMIIPIHDINNKIIYYQARAIKKFVEPKYLNCKQNKDNVIFELIKTLDITKPIIVIEGYIDSLFVENSLPVLSTNWGKEIQEELDKLNCYYLIDRDSTPESRKLCRKLIDENKYVFNWSKYLSDNDIPTREKWDINELYITLNRTKQFNFSEFEKYFTNNFYDKVHFV